MEDEDEIIALQKEFDWLLKSEVNDILIQLHSIVTECARRFPIRLDTGIESLVKSDKVNLTFTGPHDSVKISATIYGDNITNADIGLRIHKHSGNNLQRFLIHSDLPWKLNQIQDAANHLSHALALLAVPPLRFDPVDNRPNFGSGEEVIKLIDTIMVTLQKGRSALFVPKKRTIEELQSSRNMKVIQPCVPSDLAISFYVQSHKLIAAIYCISKESHASASSKFDIFHCETSLPWLSEALVLFTVALQVCQQLKDKLAVFTQYKEMQTFSHREELLTPSDG